MQQAQIINTLSPILPLRDVQHLYKKSIILSGLNPLRLPGHQYAWLACHVRHVYIFYTVSHDMQREINSRNKEPAWVKRLLGISENMKKENETRDNRDGS